MSTANDLLRVATSQLGYREGPRNNETKFAKWYGKFQYQPWCAMFVSWCAAKAKVKGIPRHAYTPSGANYFKRHGRWHNGTRGIRRGDVVYFRWKTGCRISHVGIVESVRGEQITCIEGNTQPGRGGNQSDGGGVRRRVRYASKIAGYGRPIFDGKSHVERSTHPTLFMGSKGDDVKHLQELLVVKLDLASRYGEEYAKDFVDSDFGPLTKVTVREYQTKKGLTVDGVVGNETWKSLKAADPERESLKELCLIRGDKGKPVWILQYALNINGIKTTLDGDYGNQTVKNVKAYQSSVNQDVTGIVLPETWKRLFKG